MKRILPLLLLLLAFSSCREFETETMPINGENWAPDVKEALNAFIDKYGNTENAYAVFDFDNTTSIFDIEEQRAIYQLETMSFAVDSAGLRKAISVGLNTENEDCRKYIEDICAAYGKLYRAYGPFSAKGVSNAEQTKLRNDLQWQEFATKMRKMYDKVGEWASVDDSYCWILYWFAGMSEKEVYDLAYASHRKYAQVWTSMESWTSPAGIESLVGQVSVDWTRGVQVTTEMKELWRALDENGIDVWVCSASGLQPVLAAIDAFGLHSNCTGVLAMTIEKDADGNYIPQYDFSTGCGVRATKTGWKVDAYPTECMTAGLGKVTAILNSIAPHYEGCTPLAGFMDSTGDFNFCTEFKSLRLVTCFNRANRKITDGGGLIAEIAMYEKNALGYTFEIANQCHDVMYLLQGRDENELRSFRPSNKTIRCEESEERLFANEDNYNQLADIIDRKLTVGEALNEYSKLFLSSYNGYQSR